MHRRPPRRQDGEGIGKGGFGGCEQRASFVEVTFFFSLLLSFLCWPSRLRYAESRTDEGQAEKEGEGGRESRERQSDRDRKSVPSSSCFTSKHCCRSRRRRPGRKRRRRRRRSGAGRKKGGREEEEAGAATTQTWNPPLLPSSPVPPEGAHWALGASGLLRAGLGADSRGMS